MKKTPQRFPKIKSIKRKQTKPYSKYPFFVTQPQSKWFNFGMLGVILRVKYPPVYCPHIPLSTVKISFVKVSFDTSFLTLTVHQDSDGLSKDLSTQILATQVPCTYTVSLLISRKPKSNQNVISRISKIKLAIIYYLKIHQLFWL